MFYMRERSAVFGKYTTIILASGDLKQEKILQATICVQIIELWDFLRRKIISNIYSFSTHICISQITYHDQWI